MSTPPVSLRAAVARARASSGRWATAACAALALATMPGCASKPSMSIHHAEVRGPSVGGLGIVVYLEMDNGNGFDLEIRNLRAQITMADAYRLSPVDVPLNKWLASDKKTLVAVPVSIPWSVLPRLLASTTGSSDVAYHIHGAADVTAGRTAGIHKNNVPVDESGTIPRKMIADAARSGAPF